LTARFDWTLDDPEIVSDMLFALANVWSIARTTYLMNDLINYIISVR